MATETFDATAGTAATLDARARAKEEPVGPVEHRIGPVYGPPGGDVYAVCKAPGCGRRIDGADLQQVTRLAEEHARMEREADERARCAQLAPEKLAAARAALANVAERRPEGERP